MKSKIIGGDITIKTVFIVKFVRLRHFTVKNIFSNELKIIGKSLMRVRSTLATRDNVRGQFHSSENAVSLFAFDVSYHNTSLNLGCFDLRISKEHSIMHNNKNMFSHRKNVTQITLSADVFPEILTLVFQCESTKNQAWSLNVAS